MLSQTFHPQPHEISWGHVINTVPPVWFGDARRPLLALVDDLLLPSMAFGMVRKASYTYDKELHPQEPVTIYTWIHSVGNSSANCYQEAWQNNQCAVLAETVLLAIDASTHQASPLTKDAKILLLSHSKNRRDPINQPKQTRKQEVKSL